MMRTMLVLIALVGCKKPEGTGPVNDTSDPTQVLPGADASLADLAVSSNTLRPSFTAGRALYAADADTGVVVTATPTDPDASVEIVIRTLGDQELERLANGSSLDLEAGNELIVEVTSADGTARTETQLTVIPSDFPPLEVFSDGPAPGYYFTSNIDFGEPPAGIGRYMMILDEQGIPLWLRRNEQGIHFDFRPGPGDTLTWLGPTETDPSAVGHVIDATGALLTTVRPTTPAGDPHEFVLLEDGSTIIIGNVQVARDLSAWGGPVDQVVIEQTAQHLDPDGQVLFEWGTEGQVDLDHVPGFALDWAEPTVEVAHLNSVEIDPYDGNWVISLRIPSQVVKVDRTTGEVLWRLGGPGSDFAFVGDDRTGWTGFCWQHSARVTAPDRILVFDNASSYQLGAPTGDSRFAEYDLDMTAMTATLRDEWELAGSGWVDAAGSAQRVANGNTVIGFGNLAELSDGSRAPSFVEVDPDGEVVFELRLPGTEWSYRTWKFERRDGGWVLP